jgi:uncharacterized Zn-binding protein involved in type VI secretion
MPPAARVGDKAKIPNCDHGGVCCHHPAQGPATKGSDNVNINGKPAVRVTDTGIHSSCCGSNTWTAIKGSGTVFINGLKAHRKTDTTQHCGGIGQCVEGSGDVSFGGPMS